MEMEIVDMKRSSQSVGARVYATQAAGRRDWTIVRYGGGGEGFYGQFKGGYGQFKGGKRVGGRPVSGERVGGYHFFEARREMY
jgi:hypothetical protein